MMNTIEWLKGKKTYIVAALGALVVFGSWVGLLTPDLSDKLLTLLGLAGVATLRAGIKKG